MDSRTNTIAGWILAGCGVALGASIVSGMAFHSERPDKMGYPIEGVEEEGGAGGAEEIPIGQLMAMGDPAAGANVFKKCSACHSINQGGANGIGPNLYAAVGKPHGHVGGFAYSDALKSVPGNWTFEALNAWLLSPRKYAPGTKMTFAGLSDPQDRADVIAYLNQNGSNLPLPPVEAAPAGDAPDAEAQANAAEGGRTADVEDSAAPAPGAPSVDPAAAREASEAR